MRFHTSTSSLASTLLLLSIFCTSLTSSYAAPIPLRRRSALHVMIPTANLPYWNAILAVFGAFPATDKPQMWLTGPSATWLQGLYDGDPGFQKIIDNASPIHIAFIQAPNFANIKDLSLVQMGPGDVGYNNNGQNTPLVIYQGPSPASRKKEWAGEDQEVDMDDGNLAGLTVVPIDL